MLVKIMYIHEGHNATFWFIVAAAGAVGAVGTAVGSLTFFQLR